MFASLQVLVNIRCDGQARFSNTELSKEIMSLQLPIKCEPLMDGSLQVTFLFAFPPSLDIQKEFVEHIILTVCPSRKDVYKTIVF
jgi:hypothetical protein